MTSGNYGYKWANKPVPVGDALFIIYQDFREIGVWQIWNHLKNKKINDRGGQGWFNEGEDTDQSPRLLEGSLYAMLVVYLFAGRAMANQAVTKGSRVGAVFFIQAFDEMYFATNAIVNLA